MSLRFSYSLIAPFYDLALERASAAARRKSLAQLPERGRVLLCGIGTGLDVPLLPPDLEYVGIDLTRAMLARVPRGRAPVWLVQGDAMALPFRDESFEAVVAHLIVAVVPEPRRALAESARVLKRGGSLLLLDKFLRPGERAPLRRLLHPLASRIATRLDVVFEELLPAVPSLGVESDEPAALGGWFRLIRLIKT